MRRGLLASTIIHAYEHVMEKPTLRINGLLISCAQCLTGSNLNSHIVSSVEAITVLIYKNRKIMAYTCCSLDEILAFQGLL